MSTKKVNRNVLTSVDIDTIIKYIETYDIPRENFLEELLSQNLTLTLREAIVNSINEIENDNGINKLLTGKLAKG